MATQQASASQSACPDCSGEVSGVAAPPRARRGRRGDTDPDGSTGYCMACHIGLRKTDGVWRRPSTAVSGS